MQSSSTELEPKLGAPTALMDEVYGKFGAMIFLLAGPDKSLEYKHSASPDGDWQWFIAAVSLAIS
jgi:hypothetical protein